MSIDTESQARALAPVRDDPELMAEALRAAAMEATGGRPTAKAITEALEAPECPFPA